MTEKLCPLESPRSTGGNAMTYPAYSVAQLAQRWSCSRSDIYKKIKTGTLRPFRVGGLIRFTAAYIDQIEGECGSSCTAANGPQPEPQKAKSGDARLERVIVLPPNAGSETYERKHRGIR